MRSQARPFARRARRQDCLPSAAAAMRARGHRRRRRASHCRHGQPRLAAPVAAAGRSGACAHDAEALAADVGEGAGIGRRDGAHQVVDLARRPASSRCGRPRACGRRSSCLRRGRSARSGAVPVEQRRQRRGRAPCSAAAVTLPNTSTAVSSGRIGTASWSTMRAGVGLRRPSRAASRRSRVSPCRTAQLTGARPRYFGSSEPCMLRRRAARARAARPAACAGSRRRR